MAVIRGNYSEPVLIVLPSRFIFSVPSSASVLQVTFYRNNNNENSHACLQNMEIIHFLICRC